MHGDWRSENPALLREAAVIGGAAANDRSGDLSGHTHARTQPHPKRKQCRSSRRQHRGGIRLVVPVIRGVLAPAPKSRSHHTAAVQLVVGMWLVSRFDFPVDRRAAVSPSPLPSPSSPLLDSPLLLNSPLPPWICMYVVHLPLLPPADMIRHGGWRCRVSGERQAPHDARAADPPCAVAAAFCHAHNHSAHGIPRFAACVRSCPVESVHADVHMYILTTA